MPETTTAVKARQVKLRHLGRLGQIGVYLGKLLRMFLYQSDWKVLPMSALIAGLVGVVINGRFHEYMEGTTMSALSIMCACLWNGCFNSIQVICRERGVIKREHRSGLHISSYIFAHMIYQALLCLAQAGITLYVFRLIGVSFPDRGVLIPAFPVEFLISMFLIIYAADMMSLWISSLAHTTTTAMTIMPVVLIIQLVFSGGMMSMPDSFKPVQNYTISSWGLKLISTQSDYNSQPLSTPWNALWGMRGAELDTTFTFGQAIDFFAESDNETIRSIRETPLSDDASSFGNVTVGDVLELLLEDEEDAAVQALREKPIHVHTTLGELMEIAGLENVRSYVLETTSSAAWKAEYDYAPNNIANYWATLFLFAVAFASLATITLEFIDRDKR